MSYQRSLSRLQKSPWFRIIETYANDHDKQDPLEFSKKLRSVDREDVRQIASYFKCGFKTWGQGTQKRISVVKRDFWEKERPKASEEIKTEEQGDLLCRKLEVEIGSVDLVLLALDSEKNRLLMDNGILSRQNGAQMKILKRSIKKIEEQLKDIADEEQAAELLMRQEAMQYKYTKAKKASVKIRKAEEKLCCGCEKNMISVVSQQGRILCNFCAEQQEGDLKWRPMIPMEGVDKHVESAC